MPYSKHFSIPRTQNHAPGSARRRRGMTLVETIIALFIAVVLIAAILASTVLAARLFTEAKAYTNATNIINQQVENLRTLGFTQLKAQLGVPTDGSEAVTPSPAITLSVGSQRFTVTRTARLVKNKTGGAINTDLVEMTVNVSWSSVGRTHSTSSQTYFSAFGFAAQP